jgi:hypothetical protein
MMKVALRLSVPLLALAVTVLPAAAGSVVDNVKTSAKFEGYGAATNDGDRNLFAWTESTRSPRAPFAAFVEPGRAARERMNAERTSGFVGGFDNGTDIVIFQQSRGSDSDLALWDVSRERRRNLGDLNNGAWQWSPSIDSDGSGGEWVLYGENKFSKPSSKWKVFLVNRTTDDRILLDQTTNRCRCIFPGNVAFPWVTWTKGIMGTAFRYNIETDVTEPVVLPTDRDEYQSVVTSDGTAYIAQAGDRCGTNPELWRVDPDGMPTLLLEMAAKREPLSISVDERTGRTDLYFDRFNCRSQSADILRIAGADSVATTMRDADLTPLRPAVPAEPMADAAPAVGKS